MSGPLTILIDEPTEGYSTELGWVEAIVTEAEARDVLAELFVDDDGDNFRPTGTARRVWQKLHAGHERLDFEEQRWRACEPHDLGAMEFWEIKPGPKGVYE